MEVFAGDVTTHQLQNLKPGTTYDLKVLAQYNTGVSAPLVGQGTTCKLGIVVFGAQNTPMTPRGSIYTNGALPVCRSVPERDRPDFIQCWI